MWPGSAPSPGDWLTRGSAGAGLKNPLFVNAINLLLATFINAGSGFLFWLVAAKFFSADEVGIGAALVTAMNLISVLSLLGFDIVLIKYAAHRKDLNDLVNTCFAVSFLCSLALSVVFLAGLGLWSPLLVPAFDDPALIPAFVLITALAPLVVLQNQGLFVGLRRAKYSLVLTLLALTRIAIVPLLVALGAAGIYVAYGVTPVLAIAVGAVLTSRVSSFRFRPMIKWESLKEVLRFSSGNYVARVFEYVPTYVLPLVVVSVLGAAANAYFFIAWQIAGVMMMAPSIATSQSLLAEGSHSREDLGRNVRRSFRFIILLLVPLLIVLAVLGRFILGLFGPDYSVHSYDIMMAVAVGGVPYAFNALFASVRRVEGDVRSVIAIYLGISLITLVLGLFLMPSIGLLGVGAAWIAANVIVSGGLATSYYARKGRPPRRRSAEDVLSEGKGGASGR